LTPLLYQFIIKYIILTVGEDDH